MLGHKEPWSPPSSAAQMEIHVEQRKSSKLKSVKYKIDKKRILPDAMIASRNAS